MRGHHRLEHRGSGLVAFVHQHHRGHDHDDPQPPSAVISEVVDRLGVGADTTAAIEALCVDRRALPGLAPVAGGRPLLGAVLFAAIGLDHEMDSFDAERPGDPSGWARLPDGVCRWEVGPAGDEIRPTGCDLTAGDVGNWFPFLVSSLEPWEGVDDPPGSRLDLALWLGEDDSWRWFATDYESIRAVACVGADYLLPPARTCPYGGWVEYHIPIRVEATALEASSGELIAERVFETTAPVCADQKIVPSSGGVAAVY